jgi:hypothetical protein
MGNIAKRLRTERSVYDAELCDEAADEIERLRGALSEIASGCDLSNEAQAIALEALEDSDE